MSAKEMSKGEDATISEWKEDKPVPPRYTPPCPIKVKIISSTVTLEDKDERV